MYFVNLRYLKNYDRELVKALDTLLVSFHSSSELFTPKRVGKNLNISIDLSYQLLLRARDLGVVDTIFVKKCSNCGRIYKLKKSIEACTICQNSNFKEGYYFTTDLHQKDAVRM
ncbi:MAG: hypothetical protein H0Z31_06695 [Bacillus sp. (in: Bacteria)]|jgi:hypothetical protein|nr:hypothetical protein [Bacillus sp. (in: firmicutes)]